MSVLTKPFKTHLFLLSSVSVSFLFPPPYIMLTIRRDTVNYPVLIKSVRLDKHNKLSIHFSFDSKA